MEALQQLRAAEQQFKQGEYAAALKGYTALVQQHPDLALTEYARLGQALCMYQVREGPQLWPPEAVCLCVWVCYMR